MDDRRQLKHPRSCSTASRLSCSWLCCLLLSWSSGCSLLLTLPPSEDPQSFLKSVETAPDSVALEIFQVRYPAIDDQLDQELWQAVDEQRLNVDVRHELIRNGFRAGVLGGAVPDSLAKYLKLESEMPESSAERLITGQSADPTVTRRVVQLNRNDSATIEVSAVRPNLIVWMNKAGGLCGETYQQVKSVYSMRAKAVAGQRVALQLTPELQHGDLRSRYVPGDQGIFLMTHSRERELFDELELSVEMTAGELLAVTALPDASGSLGHAFHAENQRGPAELKLVLVRLLEVPNSEILADADF